MFLWDSERWKKFYQDGETRTGLHMRFDKSIPPEIKWPCYMFCEWVRDNYAFPIRVPIYFKAGKTVRCMDGDTVSGKIFLPHNRQEEPHISIATGDFSENEARFGTEDAIFSLLCTIAHELTHYYQWINRLEQKDARNERQAVKTAEQMVYKYLYSLGMQTLVSDVYEAWKADRNGDAPSS
ncbi:hypothetical protein [Butyricicoccus sp.]|uniref:hypothetical protein n=1 Tax=Butyricicoccus sp. TaxID=2049021 RepID=UPI003F1573FA